MTNSLNYPPNTTEITPFCFRSVHFSFRLYVNPQTETLPVTFHLYKRTRYMPHILYALPLGQALKDDISINHLVTLTL